jgi:probable HAF family extracellular repeat protein
MIHQKEGVTARWVAMLSRLGAALCVSAVLAILPKSACGQSQPYMYETISLPANIAPGFCCANGVNNSGQIVGQYLDSNFVQHGFLYSGGQFTSIDFPGAFATSAVGINNAGQIVGWYQDSQHKQHGFFLAVGQYTSLDFPGANVTSAAGINNAGVIVGGYLLSGSNQFASFLYAGGSFTTTVSGAGAINDAGDLVGTYFVNNRVVGFLFASGKLTTIDPSPGCSACVTQATGINNAGTIVVHSQVSGGGLSTTSSFAFTGGQFIPVAVPGAAWTYATGINNLGWIVGFYSPTSGALGIFLAIPVSMVDAADPDLLNGPTVTSNPQLLATKGRVVQGVGADGVTEVVIRIPTANAGDQFTLTLMNDQQPPAQSSSPDEDGALGNTGATNFSLSQLTVRANAVTLPNGQQLPFAFAVYRAPLDFARLASGGLYKSGTCGSVSNTDDNLACRSVSIQIQNQTQGTSATLPITILRPPVVLIHGLWSSRDSWNRFSPLITGPKTWDSRFSVGRVSYDAPIGGLISASDPVYPQLFQLVRARANSLGFQFNAPSVLAQIGKWINSFKGGQNPAGVAAAGVQADIVAHSMGGDIARTIVLQSSFLSDDTFGHGNIHKLITIDTPHLGSPLATMLLSSQENGGCLQGFLALFGDFAFNTVTFSNGQARSGGVGDLVDSPPSFALQLIANQNFHPVPAALIVGVYTNFSSLDTSRSARFVRSFCGALGADPLAKKLNSTDWPTIFNSQSNDAIVSEASQLNGLTPSPGSEFFGYVHSPAAEDLGFSSPSVLDVATAPHTVPNQVILLLNTPWKNSAYYNMLNP